MKYLLAIILLFSFNANAQSPKRGDTATLRKKSQYFLEVLVKQPERKHKQDSVKYQRVKIEATRRKQ